MPQPPSPSTDDEFLALWIGAGQVARTLGPRLHAIGVRASAIHSRTLEKTEALASELGATACKSLQDCPRDVRVIALAVPDDKIEGVAQDLAGLDGWRSNLLVVHFSGSLSSQVLAPLAALGFQTASFHPLQSITGEETSLEGVTFGIEGDEQVQEICVRWAQRLGGRPLRLDRRQKALYHAAAVIASNYTVTLSAIASSILESCGSDRSQALSALLPLMQGTLDNLNRLGLPHALTGPIDRGDHEIVRKHVDELQNVHPPWAELYRVLARATLPIAQEKHRDRDPMDPPL